MQARYAFIGINVSSKRRPTLTRSLFGFMMEVFERTIGGDLRSRERARGAGGCRFSDRLERILRLSLEEERKRFLVIIKG